MFCFQRNDDDDDDILTVSVSFLDAVLKRTCLFVTHSTVVDIKALCPRHAPPQCPQWLENRLGSLGLWAPCRSLRQLPGWQLARRRGCSAVYSYAGRL